MLYWQSIPTVIVVCNQNDTILGSGHPICSHWLDDPHLVLWRFSIVASHTWRSPLIWWSTRYGSSTARWDAMRLRLRLDIDIRQWHRQHLEIYRWRLDQPREHSLPTIPASISGTARTRNRINVLNTAERNTHGQTLPQPEIQNYQDFSLTLNTSRTYNPHPQVLPSRIEQWIVRHDRSPTIVTYFLFWQNADLDVSEILTVDGDTATPMARELHTSLSTTPKWSNETSKYTSHWAWTPEFSTS